MMRNNKGFTIVEVLVTAVIGVLTAGVVAGYISYLSRLNHQLKIRRIAGNVVHSLSESIRFNLSLFQVSFNNDPDHLKEMMKIENLPLGISNSTLVQRAKCAEVGCQAYLGYVIIPSDIVRNLYEVRFVAASTEVRKSLDLGAEWSTEFTYFITVK